MEPLFWIFGSSSKSLCHHCRPRPPGASIVNSISRVAAAAVPPQLFARLARPKTFLSEREEKTLSDPFLRRGGKVNSVLDREQYWIGSARNRLKVTFSRAEMGLHYHATLNAPSRFILMDKIMTNLREERGIQ